MIYYLFISLTSKKKIVMVKANVIYYAQRRYRDNFELERYILKGKGNFS